MLRQLVGSKGQAGYLKLQKRGFSRSYPVNGAKNFDIGFIGLGQMGSRMAQNLVKGGKKVIVFDVVKEHTDAFKTSAQIAASPKEVAQKSSTIITMLPSSPHVKSVYLESAEKVLEALNAGDLCIDCSTIDPNVARSVAEKVSKTGAELIDAPVSGGVTGAQNATLTFMVGGSPQAFERAKPILQLMGKNIVHCGGPGNGQVAKVCNNLILGISMIGVSEAMNLGVSLGMDPKTLAGIINTSSGRCWSSEMYNPVPGVVPTVPASNNYAGGFAVDLMAKDLGLAVDAAGESKLLLGEHAWDVYKNISKEGYGRLDFAAVYKFLEDRRKIK